MTKKQSRNRYTGAAGITAREAKQMKSIWHKLDKIAEKNNLFVGYERKIKNAQQLIYEVLSESDRL